jgi:hypothetical protein
MGKGSRRGQRAAEALAALRSGDAVGPHAPSGERVEGGFTVRSVGASDRVYRCPGCAQEVVAVPHVVAWPQGQPDDRRHWHTPCWGARGRRGPTVERGRGAPRF